MPRKRNRENGLDRLQDNEKNPRKEWSSEKKTVFRESLETFGDLSGVILNTTSGVLVGGHKRVSEFREEKNAEVDIITRLDEPDSAGTLAYGFITLEGGTKFSYREVAWDPEKEAAALLAANRWSADWDWEGVSELLAEFDDFDLSLTGFDESELNPLLEADWSPPAQGDLPGEEDKATGGGKSAGDDKNPFTDLTLVLPRINKFARERDITNSEAITIVFDYYETHEGTDS